MVDKIVNVKMTSSGLKETTADAQKLVKELDKVEKKRKVSVTGSRAADAALLSSEAPISTGLGRGTAAAGRVGDTRDFARQAQGLGGLVHVYATFAANVFAVAAAFNALSKAMDFQLMEQAADTLSTRVGTSISNVARQIQTLTDGAVSLKDAFQSASLASTAGLTTKQIQGLAKAAKGASLAMGRDMTDSLNRVFRGTIKIEPELLDELGLMVKVNDVNKEYAKTLGKSALALTDFERRQAFVNGVLDQANKKYGDLADKSTNAFSKLQSSVFNLLTSIGTTLNTGLVPFINALASSPTALLALLGSLVGLLVRQAIPAFKNMAAAQTQAFNELKEKNKGAIALLDKRRKAIEDSSKAEADAEKKKAEIVRSSVTEALTKTKSASESAKFLGSYLGLEGKDVEASKAKALQAVKNIEQAVSNRLKAFQSKQSLLPDDTTKSKVYGKEYDRAGMQGQIDLLKEQQKTVDNLKASILSYASASSAYANAVENNATHVTELNKLLKEQQKLELTEKKAGIRANAIDMADTLGTVAGFKELKRATFDAANGLGRWDKAATLARGSFNILTVAATRLLSVFSVWGAVFAIAISVISGALRYFGMITDRVDKLAEASEQTTNTIKTLNDTIDRLAKATSIEDIFTFTTSKIKLQAEAVSQLKEDVSQYLDLLNKGTKTENFFEKLYDYLPIISSSGELLAKNFEALYKKSDNKNNIDTTISKEFQGVKVGKGRSSKAVTNLTSLLQLLEETDYDQEVVKKAGKIFSSIDAEKLSKAGIAMDSINSNMTVLSDNAKEYINSLTKANKEYDAANAIFSSGISALDTLNSPESFNAFGITITKLLNNLTTSTNLAYTQTSGQFAKMETLSKYLLEQENKLKKAGLSDKEINQELNKIVNTNASSIFSDLFKFIQQASRNLQELGRAASKARLDIANINSNERTRQFLNSFIGAPEGSEKFKAENTIREIELKQLRVQEKMLEAMYKSQTMEVSPGYLAAKGFFNEAKTDDQLLPLIQKQLAIETQNYNNNKNSDTMANIQVLSEALSTILKKQQAKTAYENQLFELKTERKIKESEKPRETQILDEQASNTLKLAKKRSENALLDLEDQFSSLTKYMIPSALGMSDLSKKLQDLTTGIEKTKRDLEADRLEVEQKYTVANKAFEAKKGEKLADPKELAKDEKAINLLKAQLDIIDRKLAYIGIDKNTQEFALRLSEYYKAIEALRSAQSASYDILNEELDFNLTNIYSLDKASSSVSKALLSIGAQINTSMVSLKKEEELYKAKAKYLIDEEDKLAANNQLLQARVKYHNDILALIKQQIEKEKLQRSIDMKKAEESIGTDYFNKVFSKENMLSAAQVFTSKLEEGVVTIKSAMEQVAEGFAESIGSVIDLATDLFQKGELTFRSFIDGTRNILSDMFKNIAGNMFKKAINTALIEATKNLDIFKDKNGNSLLQTDREREEAYRNTLLGHNTEAMTGLQLEMASLTQAITLKADTGLLEDKSWKAPGPYQLNPMTSESLAAEIKKIPEEFKTFAAASNYSLATTLPPQNIDYLGKEGASYDAETTILSEHLGETSTVVSGLNEKLSEQYNILNQLDSNLNEMRYSLEDLTYAIDSKLSLSQNSEMGSTSTSLGKDLTNGASVIDKASSTQSAAASTMEATATQSVKSTSLLDLGTKLFSTATSLFGNFVNNLLAGIGLSGGGGEFNLWNTMLSLGVKTLVGGIAGGISSAVGNVSTAFTYGTDIGSQQTSMLQDQSWGMANGGIMTSYGPMKLAKYASGGIATSPQLALYGEGSMNEAFVPLPDGKSIPVTMSGSAPAGDTNISIQVNISKDGQQDSKVLGSSGSDFAKQLSASVKQVVQEELVRQQRFGGLLYR